MKKVMVVLCAAVLALALLGCAAADTVPVTGTVINASPVTLSAHLGGRVSELMVHAGDAVLAGDTLAVLEGTKVCALQDGILHYFGETGDSAEMVTERYGAVAYIEPDSVFTVSASTKNAYNQEENKIIHPGEKVYLKCAADGKHTGTGMVTSVSGTSFQVEVTSGSFPGGESVWLYRTEAYAADSRIGKGDVTRKAPETYTGEGVIVRFPMENGAQVKKGDVLFETLSGSFSGQTDSLSLIRAGEDGVIASLSLNVGGTVENGSAVAELYADSRMRVQAEVSESGLSGFQPGDEVSMEFIYVDEGDYVIKGRVERISRVGTASENDSGEALFYVLIIPDETERLRYGMTAVVSPASS